VRVHPAGSEVAGGLAPVLAVFGTVPVEHGPPYASRQLLDGLHAEPGLHGAGAAQQGPGRAVLAHLPRTVVRPPDRARRRGAAPVRLARATPSVALSAVPPVALRVVHRSTP
jgi:hypothetical protein